MVVKKFKVDASADDGKTWRSMKASGWPIFTDIGVSGSLDGWVISIDYAGAMLDVIITQDDLAVMLKQLTKKKRERA